jgi:hypothetical protein
MKPTVWRCPKYGDKTQPIKKHGKRKSKTLGLTSIPAKESASHINFFLCVIIVAPPKSGAVAQPPIQVKPIPYSLHYCLLICQI